MVISPHTAFCEPVPIWSVFDVENSDLPSDAVNALAPGSDGALWIGTRDGGLARLDKDGRWRTYTKANTNGGLPSDDIRAVAQSSDTALWVGTYRGGLVKLDNDRRWQTYTEANTSGGLPADNVLALAAGSDGALWVGTTGGLAQLGRDGRWQTYTRANTNGGLPSDEVTALALDSDGALWVGTLGGLAQLGRDGRWQTYTRVNTNGGLSADYVTALERGADGALWVATLGGVIRLDKDRHWQNYGNNDAQALALGNDGALWAGTLSGGLARLDKDGHWQTYTKASTSSGLPSDTIRALAHGLDRALWVGTEGGVTRLDRSHWQTFTKDNTSGGLPNDTIEALAVGLDRALWVGTSFGGLARLDRDGHWKTYTKANTNGGLPSDDVRVLAPGLDGALWIGTKFGGLARLDRDGRWQTYTKANTNRTLPADDLFALALDSDGALWVGTSGGLARLDKDGRWQAYTNVNTNGGLPAGYVFALAFGSDGALWVGTTSGLAQLDRDGRWRNYAKINSNSGLPANDIRALAQGSDGALWIGTHLEGLFRLDRDGRWQVYTPENTNGGLLHDDVRALAFSSDGALWIGTIRGISRLDKDGHWQTYTNSNTNGGLPQDNVLALALVSDGGLWAGTYLKGIGYLNLSPTPTHEIVEVIGDIERVTQNEQTVAVVAFDHSHLTQPAMFRYVWRLTELGWISTRPEPEVRTTSPIYRAKFEHDGIYQLRVVAIDRYGMWSKPRDISFAVALPKPDSLHGMIVSGLKVLASAGILYFVLIFPLIPLYPHFSWARTATNSGVFTKFPFLHKTILNTRWARSHLFRRQAESVIAATTLPKPYIPQSLFAEKDRTGRALTLNGSIDSLTELFAVQRRALLIARSGTGKSIFLRHLAREVAARFLHGERVPLPVLIDLRTHVLSGRAVKDLVCDSLRGGGVELSDRDLSFLLGKGGFLILVDSLNELSNLVDAQLFHTFFNQDAHNQVLIASQLDLIRRDDVSIFNLAEVTSKQAAKYLEDAIGSDVYPNLPPEAQALARNPQDLVLLTEIVGALGAGRVPTHRAELYNEILNRDGALRTWVASADPRLSIIYALAFRMIAEHRVLPEGQLRDWIAAELEGSVDSVAAIIQAVQASRLFRNEVERDVLGKERPVTSFRHELVGKFLAARYVRRSIAQGFGNSAIDYIALSGDELWLEVFYFVIDEIDSAPVLNRFLMDILAAGGPTRVRIAAYAIGTKASGELDSEVRPAYAKAKLAEDLVGTPAA